MLNTIDKLREFVVLRQADSDQNLTFSNSDFDRHFEVVSALLTHDDTWIDAPSKAILQQLKSLVSLIVRGGELLVLDRLISLPKHPETDRKLSMMIIDEALTSRSMFNNYILKLNTPPLETVEDCFPALSRDGTLLCAESLTIKLLANRDLDHQDCMVLVSHLFNVDSFESFAILLDKVMEAELNDDEITDFTMAYCRNISKTNSVNSVDQRMVKNQYYFFRRVNSQLTDGVLRRNGKEVYFPVLMLSAILNSNASKARGTDVAEFLTTLINDDGVDAFIGNPSISAVLSKAMPSLSGEIENLSFLNRTSELDVGEVVAPLADDPNEGLGQFML